MTHIQWPCTCKPKRINWFSLLKNFRLSLTLFESKPHIIIIFHFKTNKQKREKYQVKGSQTRKEVWKLGKKIHFPHRKFPIQHISMQSFSNCFFNFMFAFFTQNIDLHINKKKYVLDALSKFKYKKEITSNAYWINVHLCSVTVIELKEVWLS